MGLEGVPPRAGDVGGDIIQVESDAAIRVAFPGDREQITHDPSRSGRLVIDRLQRKARLRVHLLL